MPAAPLGGRRAVHVLPASEVTSDRFAPDPPRMPGEPSVRWGPSPRTPGEVTDGIGDGSAGLGEASTRPVARPRPGVRPSEGGVRATATATPIRRATRDDPRKMAHRL